MKVHGIQGLTPQQLADEVQVGARFVVFQWCASVIVVTFKKGTDVYYLRPGQNATLKGIGWALLSFVAGWWGFWGIVYTPTAIVNDLSGGKDVTHSVMNLLMTQPSTVPFTAEFRLEPPLKNPWGEEKLNLRAVLPQQDIPPAMPPPTPTPPKRKVKRK